MEEMNNEREFFTLVDEDGSEITFELIGVTEYKSNTYYAMIPADEAEKALKRLRPLRIPLALVLCETNCH